MLNAFAQSVPAYHSCERQRGRSLAEGRPYGCGRSAEKRRGRGGGGEQRVVVADQQPAACSVLRNRLGVVVQRLAAYLVNVRVHLCQACAL